MSTYTEGWPKGICFKCGDTVESCEHDEHVHVPCVPLSDAEKIRRDSADEVNFWKTRYDVQHRKLHQAEDRIKLWREARKLVESDLKDAREELGLLAGALHNYAKGGSVAELPEFLRATAEGISDFLKGDQIMWQPPK